MALISQEKSRRLSLTGGVQEVFLSPRVVDEKAFEDFASRLRGLVEQASESGAAVRKTSEELKTARAALDEIHSVFKRQLAGASALLENLQAQRAGIERLLAEATQKTDQSAQFERSLDDSIQDRIAVFETRIAASMDAFLSELDQRIEARRSELNDMMAEADSIERRVQGRAEEIAELVRARIWADLKTLAENAAAGGRSEGRAATCGATSGREPSSACGAD